MISIYYLVILICIIAFLYLYIKDNTDAEYFEVNDNMHETEKINDPDRVIDISKLYKDNIDSEYVFDESSPYSSDVTKKERILTQQISPIIGPEGDNKVAKVNVPDNVQTRVPDDNSTEESIHIPIPIFDEKLQNDYLDQLKPTIIKLNPKKQSGMPLSKCRFIKSKSKKFKCPKKYPFSTGARFGTRGDSIQCGKRDKNSKNNIQAEAIAEINNGSITKIVVTQKGSNYTKPPKIKIVGDGRYATAYAKIKKGKVYKIIIKKKGKKYTSSPSIEIEKPQGYLYCHLCCRS